MLFLDDIIMVDKYVQRRKTQLKTPEGYAGVI